MLYRYARLLSGLFFIAFLSACASTPQTARILESPPTDIRQKVELEDVAFFPQRAFQCGPSALATVLDYQGLKIIPDDLTEKVYLPEKKGSLQLEMIATARSYGLQAYKINPDLNTILKEINQGNPVLVFQNLSLQYWPQWHYAVIVGYDLNKAELILRSGEYRRHITRFSTFERTWQRAKHWAYILVNPGEIPLTANPVNYIQTSHDLALSGFEIKALKSFRQAAKRWPANSIVLMTLANTEFSAGNYDRAEQAFNRELNQRPDNVTAWNNLAYVLASKNCKTQAVEAIHCAALISPDDKNIQKSKNEILQMPAQNSGSCEKISCPETNHIK